MKKRTTLAIVLLTAMQHYAGMAQPDPHEAQVAVNPNNWQGVPIQQMPLNLHILKPDGTPLSNGNVALDFNSANSSYSYGGTRTDAQGTVSVSGGFSHRHYAVYASALDIGSGYLRDADIQGAGAPRVDLQLQAGSNLRIVVREAGANEVGRAIGGASVNLRLVPDVQNPNLNPAERGLRIPGATTVTNDTDGILEVDNLAPAHYEVTVQSLPIYEPATQQVDIKEKTTTSLEFTLNRETATYLKVTLRDPKGEPIRDTDVPLSFASASPNHDAMWQRDRNMNLREAHTDANGEFTLYPVMAGTWRVYSWGRVRMNNQVPRATPKFRIEDTEVKIPSEGGSVSLIAQPLQQPGQ